MFFRADDYLRLRDRVVAAGCDVPILPGVMPVTNWERIQRIVQLSGQAFPADFADRLHAARDDKAAMRAIGVEHATAMCERLLREGAPGLHFITFNVSTTTLQIRRNLEI
jgi:methylenetetrahydrofolate reductase (NADPH)